MNTPQVKFRVEDFTATVGTPTEGVSFVLGRARRGKINNPDQVFTSWESFLKEHGGVTDINSAAKIKRIFDGGGAIRFCNLSHYTDIDDASTREGQVAMPIEADPDFIGSGGAKLFGIAAKHPGNGYNQMLVSVRKASNNKADHFNLSVTSLADSTIKELYENLKVDERLEGSYVRSNLDFLSIIEKNSKVIKPIYYPFDLAPIVGSYQSSKYVPLPMDKRFSNGGDPSVINAVDMIGSPVTQTGLYSFDEYEDSLQIFYLMPNDVPSTVHVAANAYAETRKDLQYWMTLSKTSVTKDAMVAERELLGINSKYTNIFGGIIKVAHPITGVIVEQDPLADIAALAANSDKNFGTHFSFSGNKRGILRNVLGLKYNFGTSGRFNDLNELAQSEINTVINRDSQIKLWGSCTSLKEQTQERFINVVRATMTIKKNLRPLLEDYLEEPNDMNSWKLMYYQVKPYLDSLVDKRALFSYRWEGDQAASSLQDLVINDPADVTNGKYKVRLFLSFITSMQEIEVSLVLVPGNLSFEQVGNGN